MVKAIRLMACIAAVLSSCQSNTGVFSNTAVIGERMLVAGTIPKGLILAALDEQDRKVMERSSPRTVDRMDRGDPLTINDVIKLSQGGVSDETVIQYMREAGTSYNLSQGQIRRLQEAGVSQRVVNYMVDSGV